MTPGQKAGQRQADLGVFAQQHLIKMLQRRSQRSIPVYSFMAFIARRF
jgi:hypothetical protein